MLAANFTTVRDNLKSYCDKVTDEGEALIVTRKDEKNVVVISLDEYNSMQKRLRNAEYLAKLDKSIEQLRQGKVVVKTMEELEAMEK